MVCSSESRRRGAGLPRPARSAAGRARPDRQAAALHPDPHPVARRRPRRLPHHHRRFTGEDRLAATALAVPGARRDAGQRGRRRRHRARFRLAARRPEWRDSVDTAQHLWTLDNPAYGWFGLSSAVRVRVGSTAVRAVSVAEVVSPSEEASGPLARELMVALVRAGVTATCSGADKPRYGDLAVDSNLPDTRIALGGPTRNAFTKAVLAEADPGTPTSCNRQLAKTGRATGVGAGGQRIQALARRLGARRRPAAPARTAGAGDRRLGRQKADCGDRVPGRRPRRRRDRGHPSGPAGRRRRSSPSKPAPSRCSTAECRASPSTPTAPCTPR